MKEPSVLDYVKSKLAFWKPSSIEIPDDRSAENLNAFAAGETAVDVDGEDIQKVENEAGTAVLRQPQEERVKLGAILLLLGSLALALLAQGSLEPPNRNILAASLLYGGAAVLLGVAYFRNLVQPAEVPADIVLPDLLSFRKEGLAIGLAAMVLAFWAFGTPAGQEVPVFNFVNTALWLLSIGYLVWAFYLPREGWNSLRDRTAAFFSKPSWKLNITRWTILLLVVTGVVLFFRFYRLDSMLPEMVSDHAEKLLDVNDVLNGQYRVFFPRNTGREAFQFFWTALMVKVFNTGVSFMALKLGTTLIGLLTLYYMYRLGLEIANRWVAIIAVLFCGFSYWAVIMSRVGLRFPLYPGFLAPMLFYMIRGLRTSNRNDFIWAGIWMGIGLHGYTSYRIVPFVAVAGFIIYILHHRSVESRRSSIFGLSVLALISLAVFLPLFRFIFDQPEMVAFRSLTRIGNLERPIPGSPVLIFLQNTWNALMMFFWDNGDVWVHSIPHRPAMDVITAALLFLGLVLVILRYIRKRNWVDLFLLVSIPMLLLPSIFSLAFPNENPNLNRTAGAYIPAFLIMAIGLEGLLAALRRSLSGRVGTIAAWGVGLTLVIFSATTNFDLVFNQFDLSMRLSGWNSAEMGAVVRDFSQSIGKAEDTWVVAYPYWVDTRLVGINAGFVTRDMGISPDDLGSTKADPRVKLFLLNMQDSEGLSRLTTLYPEGRSWLYTSKTPGKDFVIFLAPPQNSAWPEPSAASLLGTGQATQP
jgi:4-amino-4-deoxy-L-arabinose transferase-like glycosyltransferase